MTMKSWTLILAMAVLSQAAEIARNLRPRSELFPRAPVPQGPGHIVVTEPAAPVDMRGFCGQRKVDSSRIVGGVEAVPHEFPWQVAVTIDGEGFCGGTLISPDWVMTAAYCVDGARQLSLLLGAHDRTVAEASQLTIETTEYGTYPNWNPATLANNIALIRLPTPVTFTPEIAPLCIAPSTEPDHVGDALLVSGWGLTIDDIYQPFSPILMKVTAPGMQTSSCAASYIGNIITDKILCIDTSGGHGSCNGDWGGPLSFESNGVYNQVGVFSFSSASGCTAGYPAAFTRVSSYAQWISLVTGLVI